MLIAIVALDEAASGLPVAGAFALQRTYAVDMATLTTAVFVVPQLVALVEAPLLVWSEGYPRPRVMGFGLLGMALATVLCAVAPNVIWIAAGCALYYPSSGIACGIAEAALMDAYPEAREQKMADWAAAGWIGDLATPPLLWAAHAVGVGWRGAFLVGAASILAAIPLLTRTLPKPANAAADDDNEAPRGIGTSLKLLFTHRLLFLWLGGVALCSLHDEILASFAGLRIFHETHSTRVVTWNLSALTLGGICGLALLKRWLKRSSSEHILRVGCWGSAIVYVAWLLSASTWAGIGLMFVSGVFVSLHYPIALAAAYRALPGRSTLVAAAGQAFAVFDLAMPVGLGWLADRWGVMAPLWVLLLQPLGLLVVVHAASRGRR